MPYPAGVTVRSISFGQAVTLEGGIPLTISVTTTASRSLIRNPQGYRLEQMAVLLKSVEAGDQIVLELPITTQSGWLDAATREAIIVGPNQHSHLYTTELTVFTPTGTALRKYTIGPYPLPPGTGVLDGDTMLIPDETTSGTLVPIPQTWVNIIASANALLDPAGSTSGQVLTSTGPNTAPEWADAEGGGLLIRPANSAGVYPARGTAEQIPVQWIGPTQPVVALPDAPVDWLTQPIAMAGFDLFDRVVT